MGTSSSELLETLKFTPTWVVAAVCTVIVAISLFAERFLHYLGKFLKHNRHDALYEALEKLKEELMLLGFISLLLTVFQRIISEICVPASVTSHMLPCKKDGGLASEHELHHANGFSHGFPQNRQRILSEDTDSDLCTSQMAFFKQFYASVTKSDYRALRSGFIMRHCSSNTKFDFHNYMMRALEDDFKIVVGISWYLWLFVVVFLLLNVKGWHMYFWLSFLPLLLLLAVGAKLEHIITRLAQEAAERAAGDEQEAPHVKPSDHHFWFKKPGIILYLIHFILFQNSFEVAFVIWIWSTYGFNTCIMEGVGHIIPRLVVGVIVQVLCSYSTLPLYAIVTQFKQAIFAEQLRLTLHGWAEDARKRKRARSDVPSFLKVPKLFSPKRCSSDAEDGF